MNIETNCNTTKAEATRKAKYLLSLLTPAFSTFKIQVWQNLGWHYQVGNGHISVGPSIGVWRIMFSPHKMEYGSIIWDRDPVKGIRRALVQREEFVQNELRALVALKESLW